MNESYYAGVYWGARKESSEECARRLKILLEGLPSVAPSLERWFQQGKSRADALKRPLHPTLAELEPFVRKGKDRTFDDLGFSIGGWNGAGDDYEATGFLLACGGYSEWGGNRCVYTLPSKGPSFENLLSATTLAELMRRTAGAWEPDWGVAISEQHRDLLKPRRPKGAPYVGWVTYLARHRGMVPSLPAPVRVELVEGKGTLIILTPERFTASNPDHVALAEQVRELLDRAGLLKPLQAQP
ncbi:immunity 52 family protein [Myxococcus stipitatus]|uniref:immunity 52 family protein n=1 Tax=Myxococcus stipitatus TaxID=83455 RepID=UPI0030D3ED6B